MVVRRRAAGADAPRILFIHGLGESGLCFEHLLNRPELAAFELLVPDLPGYGRSPWPDAPGGLVGHADHLGGWLAQMGGPPPVVVGHSMGGVVGLLLAERHPAQVDALVDVDGNNTLTDCTFSSQAANDTAEGFRSHGFDRLRQTVFRAGLEDPAQRGYYVSLRLADPATYHADSLDLVALSRQEELAQRLASVAVPRVYIAGVPHGASARSLELLEAARVPTIPIGPSGHWPFIDQPDQFVAALLGVAQRAGSGGGGETA